MFACQFEFHKIPEWYDDYLDYTKFISVLARFRVASKLEK